MLKSLLAALLALTLTGCAGTPQYDYACKSRDQGPLTCSLSEIFHPTQTPWDPRPGQSLMDQIPNWDGEAERVCCGHKRTCDLGQSPRC